MIVKLDPRDRLLTDDEGALPVPTVRFEPRNPQDEYPLWVPSTNSSRVEWWLDDRPLTNAQSTAFETVCGFLTSTECGPSRLDYRNVRVHESADCLEFVFRAMIEDSEAQTGFVEDTSVFFDKRTLKATLHCP